MSSHPPEQKAVAQSVQTIRARKGKAPIVCLTAYSQPMASLLDPHVDLLLVGDSLGMVLYGEETTLPVRLSTMIAHGRAVRRGCRQACLVVDMPFGSYQESPGQAFRNAAKVMAQSGCDAIKLEGGVEMAETIAFLVARGIPVLGHVGLKPQAVRALGGYRAQGRDEAAAKAILEDAKAVEGAGAFALVVEGVMAKLADQITASLTIPTIGIGASASCDGQILVSEDMLGLTAGPLPRFVKRYATLGEQISMAVQDYAQEVRDRAFPAVEQTYGPGIHGPGTHGPGTHGPGTHGPGTHGPGTHGPGKKGES